MSQLTQRYYADKEGYKIKYHNHDEKWNLQDGNGTIRDALKFLAVFALCFIGLWAVYYLGVR